MRVEYERLMKRVAELREDRERLSMEAIHNTLSALTEVQTTVSKLVRKIDAQEAALGGFFSLVTDMAKGIDRIEDKLGTSPRQKAHEAPDGGGSSDPGGQERGDENGSGGMKAKGYDIQ